MVSSAGLLMVTSAGFLKVTSVLHEAISWLLQRIIHSGSK